VRSFVFVILISSLLAIPVFLQKGDIPVARASSSVYQGDLILTNDNVTIIEGRFDINGSIIVQDNATLRIQNAFLNLVQTRDNEHWIQIESYYNNNARVFIYNSTVTSDYMTFLSIYGSCNVTIDDSTISGSIWSTTDGLSKPVLSISNSSLLNDVWVTGCTATIHNSTIHELQNYHASIFQICDSQIDTFLIGPDYATCTISDLKPGFFDCWNFAINCSVSTPPSVYIPDITVINSTIGSWRLAFYESSDVSISRSVLKDLSAITGPSVIFVVDSAVSRIYIQGAFVRLVNTTYSQIEGVVSSSQTWIAVAWYLDVFVTDLIGQVVPSANVTAYYQNETMAESKLTDANGTARLILVQKVIYEWNQEYSIQEYSVQATYAIHLQGTQVSMTGNQHAILKLDFTIPEFPSFLILPLFMIVTLLAVIVYRRKHTLDNSAVHLSEMSNPSM